MRSHEFMRDVDCWRGAKLWEILCSARLQVGPLGERVDNSVQQGHPRRPARVL